MSPPPHTIEEAVAAIRESSPEELGALFTRLAASPAGRALAWDALRQTCDRATSGQSLRRGPSAFFEREIRRLGPVVAWREDRVTEQRSLVPAADVELRVCASPAEADALVASELDATGCQWGIRPGPDELGDLRAHFLERKRLLAAGDAAALAAYCARYTTPLFFFDRQGRAVVALPWEAGGLLGEVVSESDDPALAVVALDLGAAPHSIRWAAAHALRLGRSLAVHETLVARLADADVDAEQMDDTLLAAATRARRADAVAVLLARKARPNVVLDAFHVNPPFDRCAADGNGPMVNAVRAGDVASLALLLAAGGDPLAKTRAGRRVIDLARELGDPAVLSCLEATGAAEGPLDLGAAIANGDVARVLELLPTEGTATALQECAQRGLAAVLGPVLASGVPCDPAALAKALWYSAANGHLETTKLLIEHGADPNGFVQHKKTARAMAAFQKRTAIAALLAKAGGKLRAPK